MFRLTREVRFAINPQISPRREHPSRGSVTNSYAGYPSLAGLGYFLAARVTLAGELDPSSQYLVNIKSVDEAVRTSVIPAGEIAVSRGATASDLLRSTYDSIRVRWPALLESVSLSLSPFLTISVHASEHPMTRLSQKFEFSASHRLHNPQLSDDENRRIFGKCNNALGHGHNYEVQVTLIGDANVNGLLVDIPVFERTVAEIVIDKFDHKHLNTEVPQFRDLIPSVENIAKVIYQLLAPKLKSGSTKLHSVTVWETPKTWCEYSEEKTGRQGDNETR